MPCGVYRGREQRRGAGCLESANADPWNTLQQTYCVPSSDVLTSPPPEVRLYARRTQLPWGLSLVPTRGQHHFERLKGLVSPRLTRVPVLVLDLSTPQSSGEWAHSRGKEGREDTSPICVPAFNTLAYQETGASWAHTTLVGPPGKTEGMVHRHVHLVGIWPASSGHNPGFQDRWEHLRKKQRRHGPSQPAWLGLSATAALFRNPSLHRAGLACLRSLFQAGPAFLLPSLRSRKQTAPSLMGTTLSHPPLTVLLLGLSLTLQGELTLPVQSASRAGLYSPPRLVLDLCVTQRKPEPFIQVVTEDRAKDVG